MHKYLNFKCLQTTGIMKYVFKALCPEEVVKKKKILPLCKRLWEQLYTVSKYRLTDYLLMAKEKKQLYSGETW